MIMAEEGRRGPWIWEPGRPTVCGACGRLVLTPWLGRCEACGRVLPRAGAGPDLGTTCAACGGTDHRALRAYPLGGATVALCTDCAALAAAVAPGSLAQLRGLVRHPSAIELQPPPRSATLPVLTPAT